MTVGKLQVSGATDTVNGYTMNGSSGTPMYSTVERFVYSSEADSTDIGEMTLVRYCTGGASSATHGYAFAGGHVHGTMYDRIDKFNFAGSFSSTDVGNVLAGRQGPACQSSTVSGYCTGGTTDNTNGSNVIQKVDFSSDGDSTDVGNLTGLMQYGAGSHY